MRRAPSFLRRWLGIADLDRMALIHQAELAHAHDQIIRLALCVNNQAAALRLTIEGVQEAAARLPGEALGPETPEVRH
jgi:hypothetical protein